MENRTGKATGVVATVVSLVVVVVMIDLLSYKEASMSESAVLSVARSVLDRKSTEAPLASTQLQHSGSVSGSGDVSLAEPPGSYAPLATCPIQLPACSELRYSKGAGTESWKTIVDTNCREYAEALLVSLRDADFSLAQSGYMDMFGQAWGCTVRNADDDVFIITLIPDQDGATRGSDNGLQVSVVHVFEPKF